MAPPIETFPASQLPYRIQAAANGKRRKGKEINLNECELMEMVQHSCWLEGVKQDLTVCKPIVKLFRRCAGGLVVETTAWEEGNQPQQARDG
ncbi:MAG: hypothetical protein L6R36_005419 [Xanthoria steineri]|nr:MAG: hypothetical protein L6R36_005419 [Xanthoria steineri]